MTEPRPGAPAGIEAARLPTASAGYCVLCNRIVVRESDGSCPQGHAAGAVTGKIAIVGNEQPPQLGRFNLAAFLIPMLWGPGHDVWAGAVFLPMWLFVDSTLRNAGRNTATMVAAGIVTAVTLALQAWFATTANGLAWRRVADHETVGEYNARQRGWAIAAVPVAIALISLAAYFDLVVRPARGL